MTTDRNGQGKQEVLRMQKRRARKDAGAAGPAEGKFLDAIILERLRRLNSLPLHPLDWRTEFVLNHFLGWRKRI